MSLMNRSAIAVVMALMLSAPAFAQGIGAIPSLSPVPEEEAVKEVDGALTLGAPAPRPAPQTKPAVEPALSTPINAPSRSPLPPSSAARTAATPPTPAPVAATPVSPRPAAAVPAQTPASPTRATGSLTPPPASRPATVNPQDEIARMQAEVERAQAAAANQSTRPPPAELTIKPGRTEVLSIAGKGQLNRLVTPFARPYVRTTAQGTTTSVEGSVIYLATVTSEPVSLFIMDEGDELNAISLTLNPRDIPAAQVRLKLEGYQAAVLRPASIEQAQSFEVDQAHTETLRSVMKALAMGEVPPGYGITQFNGKAPLVLDCLIDGVQILPAQLVTGANLQVVVARVQNTSQWPVELDESQCASDYTLGVAAWPRTVLQPGEATELFVATRRDMSPRSRARPSTLQGGY